MTDMQQVTIPLSRAKMIFLIFLSSIFLVVGYSLLRQPAVDIGALGGFYIPFPIHGVGLVGMVLGGLGIAPWLGRLFVTSPGFVLNSHGLTDNSSPLSPGFIPWTEIKGFRVFENKRKKILYVVLKDPKKYVAGFKPVKRMVLRAAWKMGGSPVFITTGSLAVKFSDLLSMVNQGLIAYRQSAPNHSFEADGFTAAQLQR